MPPPLRVEEAALERRAREDARAGVASGGQVGKALVAQHSAGEGAGAGGRLRVPVELSLRGYILLRGPIVSDASGLCCCRSARSRCPGARRCRRARCRGLPRQIAARARLSRLGKPLSTAAAGIAAGDLRLLLRWSRRGPWRRRVPRHGRSGRAAGGTGRLLRRNAGRLRSRALRGRLRRRVTRRGNLRRGSWRGDVRSGRARRRRCRVRCGRRRSGSRVRRGRCRVSAHGNRGKHRGYETQKVALASSVQTDQEPK